MRRSRADLVILLLVLGGFIVGNVWLVGRSSQRAAGLEFIANASAFNRGPSGLFGLYTLWRKLGHKTRVWRRPWTDLPEAADVFVVATPFAMGAEVTSEEPPDLLRWVRGGGTLLVLGSDPDLAAELELRHQSGSELRSNLHPAAPTRLLEGVDVFSLSGDRWAGPLEPVVVHLHDQRGPALLSRPMGRGRIVALADSGALANAHLGDADNAILGANLAGLADGPTYFDEFHHGYEERPTLAFYLLRPPLLWVTLQVLFALLLFFHAASRRFGPPLPPPGAPKYRASAEHVEAMASLYQRAGARGVALRRLAEGFRREVNPHLGLPVNAPRDQIAEAAARRVGADPSRVERLFALCEEQVAPRGGPKETALVSAASELEILRRRVLYRGHQTPGSR